jgi:hypothetical protein
MSAATAVKADLRAPAQFELKVAVNYLKAENDERKEEHDRRLWMTRCESWLRQAEEHRGARGSCKHRDRETPHPDAAKMVVPCRSPEQTWSRS